MPPVNGVSKVLIANRGAIARRIVRACDALGLQSVAVYSPADAHAPYLEEATEAYALQGVRASESYLDQAQLLDIARRSGADSVHPGYGFLAENASFVEACEAAGLVFIGPASRWVRDMGDKVLARALFARHEFPVFAGSERLQDAAAAVRAAQEIGYPVLVKPSGGGGGMGMEVVTESAQLRDAIARAGAIAESAFGDAGVYLERYLTHPRHIEFQIIADGQSAMHVYERECSVQRRNQKLIEESPAPGLSAQRIARYADLAASVCGELGYDNVGTLETLFADDDVGFLEMNTRIQVEHGVTEMVTGLDLVAWQIRLATGQRLPETRPARDGFAIEARVYAEDSTSLLPSTGTLQVFDMPELHGVRFETGYRAGQVITPYYDALLAKIIAHGSTREMAIGRLLVALQAFTVRGVATNQALLRRVLQDAAFLAGEIDTGIVQRMTGERRGAT